MSNPNRKPLIGVPGRRKIGNQVQGFEGTLDVIAMDVYLTDYSLGILQAGGLPVNLAIDADPADYVIHLDGVLLTGGADIDPGQYGHHPDGNGGYENERDAFELDLLAAALDADLPVLGVCRGLQILNVHLGGTLHQHVPSHSRYDTPIDQTVHSVRLEPGSCVFGLYGATAEVNSLHHQAVDTLGHGLVVTGRADDGTIEAIELAERQVVAVQWHPEMLDHNDPSFGWLVGQSR